MQLDLYPTPFAPDANQPLSQFLTQRKVFITIDDATEYKRCRVQSNRKGVVLRDLAKGAAINTKKQQLCRSGDFLVAEIDAKVGGYGFVPTELDGAIVSSHYYLFEVNETRLLPAYLHYLTQSDIIQSQISSQGSTNYAAIRPKEFLAIEIPYVEVDQQREIVARLDALTLETTEFNQESVHQAILLTRLRQAILREAVQGRLLPQDATDEPASALLARIRTEKQRLVKEKKLRAEKPLPPLSESEVPYNLPQGWVWCRLGEIIEALRNGISEAPNASSGTPILRISSLRPNSVNLKDIRFLSNTIDKYESCLLEENDLLFTRYSGNSDFVGICGVVPALTNATVYPDKLMRAKLLGALSPEFVAYAVNTGVSRAFIAELLKTTAGQVGVAGSQLKNTPIPLPPIAEQRRIVVKVAELLDHCTELEAELGRARGAASALHAAALREAFRPVLAMVNAN